MANMNATKYLFFLYLRSQSVHLTVSSLQYLHSVEKERDQFNRTMDDTSSFGSNSGQRLGGSGRRSFLKIKVRA